MGTSAGMVRSVPWERKQELHPQKLNSAKERFLLEKGRGQRKKKSFVKLGICTLQN